MSDKRAELSPLVCSIDQAELIVRVIEAVAEVSRPIGDADEIVRRTTPAIAEQALRAGMAANAYLLECLRAAGATIDAAIMPPTSQDVH